MEHRNEVSIEITRHDGILSSVSVIMPVWNKKGSDGKLYAKIPFFGMETCGVDEDDLQVAIKEALTCFCVISEKHGVGLEGELESLGWTKAASNTTDSEKSFLEAISSSEAFGLMLDTGNVRALHVDMPNQILQAA